MDVFEDWDVQDFIDAFSLASDYVWLMRSDQKGEYFVHIMPANWDTRSTSWKCKDASLLKALEGAYRQWFNR